MAHPTILVHVYGIGNLVPALAAVLHYRRLWGRDELYEVVPLLHFPGSSEERTTEVADVLAKIWTGFGWPKPVALSGAQMDSLLAIGGGNLEHPDILRRFRQAIGREQIDQIYYCHDVTGFAASLAMRAYPDARRIMYGDGLGQVLDKPRVIAVYGGVPWTRELKRQNRLKNEPDAQAAVMALPADVTGEGFYGKELQVVPKALVLEIIERLWQSAPELRQYCAAILQRSRAPRYIFALPYLHDCGLATIDNEIAFYAKALENVPRGSSIVLKPHPFNVTSLESRIIGALGTEYVFETVPPSVARLPLEIWLGAVESFEFISFGYTSVSFRYLFGKSSICEWSREMIDQFVLPEKRVFAWEVEVITANQRRALDSWDGRSVLWRGEDSFDDDRARVAPDEALRRGVEAFQSENTANAVAWFRLACTATQLPAEAPLNLAIALWKLGEYKESLEVLRKAHGAFPKHRAIHFNLIAAERLNGPSEVFDRLVAQYRSAFGDDPELVSLLGAAASTSGK